MSELEDAIVADGYTPTTEQMREDWGALVVPVIAPPKSARAERLAEFDRWLAAHDREVAAEGWDKAIDRLLVSAVPSNIDWLKRAKDANPYREGSQ